MSPLDQYLSLRQKPELALKPKMLQSLKMLSLPILELEAYIKQELINNPLLELREEKDEEDLDDRASESPSPESNNTIEETEVTDDHSETLAEAKELTDILDQWNEYHQSYEGYQGESEQEHTESYLKYEEDSKAKFLEQLYPYQLTEDEFDFALELVDSCDIYGFLPKDYDFYESASSYGISNQRADEIHESG